MLSSMEPMDKAIPGLVSDSENLTPVSESGAETSITTLENGLRVASQEAYGQYSTVGGG